MFTQDVEGTLALARERAEHLRRDGYAAPWPGLRRRQLASLLIKAAMRLTPHEPLPPRLERRLSASRET